MIASGLASLSLVALSIMTFTDRVSPCKIRRAAGNKDPSVLREAIAGWTCQELDNMASQDGKSALHMAAWQGCLENVELLLDLGCNINVIATGQYSYGKTPIFFAATKCRDDMVQFLLQHTDAHVKIVNNKGQSVLSIASSHLKQETIDMIQRAESRQEEEEEWLNFRATHSDGLQYGDLDPRFLDRPLTATDVVTPLAINPTTKQSRKGGFARKNPYAAKEIERRKEKAQLKQRVKTPPPALTVEEVAQQEVVWQSIESCISKGDYSSICDLLLCVIQFEERQRRLWIPEAAARLQSFLFEATDDMVAARLEEAIETFTRNDVDCTPRQVMLLEKWIQQVCRAPSVSDDERVHYVKEQAVSRKQRIKRQPVNLASRPWSTACKAVQGLLPSLLQNPLRHDTHLSLPEPPMWIDSERHLVQLDATLLNLALESNPCIVALDTEWYTTQDDTTHASTIQISTVIESDGTKQIQTWVVDLLPATDETADSSSYRKRIRDLLLWLFADDSNVILLGFAFAHDITMLHTLCDSLSSSKCLDVQRLAAQEMKRGRRTLPGLQACAAQYLSQNGNFVLSKEQQCSDWARRPLREAQLEYAGLDAAVLLVLLAEITNQTCKED